MKRIIIAFSLVSIFLASAAPVLAHVVVNPKEVGVGQRLNFSVSVPTEKDVSTTEVRLIIPEGLESVRPNVKPGWTIEIKTESVGMKGEILNTGEEAPRRVTEIIWSGGSIPPEQRDEFVFSAQAPIDEASIVWKAYQTYGDGVVVAWDKDPKEVAKHTDHSAENGEDAPKPYSETKVINDLSNDLAVSETLSGTGKNLPLSLSIVALILSTGAVAISIRK